MAAIGDWSMEDLAPVNVAMQRHPTKSIRNARAPTSIFADRPRLCPRWPVPLLLLLLLLLANVFVDADWMLQWQQLLYDAVCGLNDSKCLLENTWQWTRSIRRRSSSFLFSVFQVINCFPFSLTFCIVGCIYWIQNANRNLYVVDGVVTRVH